MISFHFIVAVKLGETRAISLRTPCVDY